MALTQAERSNAWRERQKEKMEELEVKVAAPQIDLDNPLPVENMTAMEYALSVMNNPYATKDRRDRMAIAILQHQAKVEAGKTKKEEKADAAKEASSGRFAAEPAPMLKVA